MAVEGALIRQQWCEHLKCCEVNPTLVQQVLLSGN